MPDAGYLIPDKRWRLAKGHEPSLEGERQGAKKVNSER
jgi:hypothetical protein